MEKKVFIFLAEGFEEIEAITTIDLLRRAELNVITVAVGEDKIVKGSVDIPITADVLISDIANEQADALVLPGGLPGANNLYASKTLQTMLLEQNKREALIAAICASPAVVLGSLEILKGKEATCYPSFEDKLIGAKHSTAPVVRDGHIITGRGPAFSMHFAFEIIRVLKGEETYQGIAQGTLFEELITQ